MRRLWLPRTCEEVVAPYDFLVRLADRVAIRVAIRVATPLLRVRSTFKLLSFLSIHQDWLGDLDSNQD
jgi:hypothetical protein